MDNRAEVRDFLRTRRAKITPERAGLPAYGPRRVPGLRRDEVAWLAGVSVDYYVRLEKGNLSTASDSVLTAIAGALQLDEAERTHLFALARASRAGRSKHRRPPSPAIRPAVQHFLDTVTGSAVLVRNGRFDILAANALGRAVWAPALDAAAGRPNMARFAFLDPAARDFYRDWAEVGRDVVALLRTEAGRDPYDKDLTDLVGELATRSEPFRTWWATHDVELLFSGVKALRHPVAGEMTLTFTAMTLPSDPGLTINTYTAEPGSASEEKLRLLASWSATNAPQHRTAGTEHH
ncbi:helix-turn-helix transcriptional regulator [Actinoplanes sp. RD1]|uniref:helix-turn-helix transcriptional regulator n=1 Tax=Actinoplanes sp. RD1 TaxID=3064538 RepID=UPI002741F3E1|nr:helix-turn-helix transcriptional regulator [Actinoplanes sp. RD1]